MEFAWVPAARYTPDMAEGGGSAGRRFLSHWFRRETIRRGLAAACVVGPVLTVINQYDVLLSLDFSARLWVKVGLTFLVPYSVSSYSSARAFMDRETAISARTTPRA